MRQRTADPTGPWPNGGLPAESFGHPSPIEQNRDRLHNLLVVGISYKMAPLALRERIAFPGDSTRLLQDLSRAANAEEAVSVSTCNRTEAYLVVSDVVRARSAVITRLSGWAGVDARKLRARMYVYEEGDAARHLFRVTAGLDSMIVGEAEVQGQVKRAYEDAVAKATVGPLTNRLFRAALSAGKRVRTETAISKRNLSLAGVAVSLAREVVGDLKARTVVLIGTGQASELTARALADSGARTVFVANRRWDRAVSLANRFNAGAVELDELGRTIEEADVVVAATSAPDHVLGAPEIAAAMDKRRDRPLLLIDLAVPRDIDPAAAAIAGTSLYNVDDLQAAIATNRSVRAGEALKAEKIIAQEVERFTAWLGGLEVLPTVAALRGHALQVVEQVVHENDGKWESASSRDLQRTEAIARAIVNRLLHEPTRLLKELHDDRVAARLEVVRELFGLDEDPAGPGERGSPASQPKLNIATACPD